MAKERHRADALRQDPRGVRGWGAYMLDTPGDPWQVGPRIVDV
jgi:hypothetical protein